MSAAIRHSSGGWNPGGEPNNLDTGLRRYDVKLFLEIESLVLGQIYADLHRRGELIGDADILIAATAIEYKLAVVSNNKTHFCRIPDLQLENWLA